MGKSQNSITTPCRGRRAHEVEQALCIVTLMVGPLQSVCQMGQMLNPRLLSASLVCERTETRQSECFMRTFTLYHSLSDVRRAHVVTFDL